jgi:hypothetical protein
LTAAFADARFASRVAELTLELLEDDDEFCVELAAEELFVFGVLVALLVPFAPVLVGVEVVVVVGAVLVLVGALVVVVGVAAGAVAVPGAVAVALCEAARASTDAVDAIAAVAVPVPAEDCPVEDSPSVSSSLARFASADCRLAFACSSVTSALCGSSAASSWPGSTCSPCVT